MNFRIFSEWESARFGTLLLSVFIATVLWAIVNSSQSVEEKRQVKIQYTKLPASLTFERMPLKEMPVNISAPLYRLRGVRDDDLSFLVDLSSAKPGANRVDLTMDALKLPLDIEASFPTSQILYVYLEEVVLKQLPLKAKLTGRLSDSLDIGNIRFTPNVVTVSGPKSLVSKLDIIPFEISLDGRSSSFQISGRPQLDVPQAEVHEDIIVDVEINAQRSSREFTQVPIRTLGKQRVSIEPAVASVFVEGSEIDLQRLGWLPEVLIETKGLKKGRYLLRGQVDVPSELKIIEIKPRHFLVEVME